MDWLTAMRIYVRVVERGSMSAAARDLSLGQPAVSDRIDRLERALGVRLLQRNTHALACTDEGAVFYEHAKRALEAADAACASVRQDKAALRGMLRIAAPQALGEALMPPVIHRLRTDYPELEVSLVLNDRFVDPVTEGVDLSLRLGQLADGHFIAHRLGQVRRVLVSSQAYLTRAAVPDAPEALVDHPFIRVAGVYADAQLRLVGKDSAVLRVPLDIAVTASHWRPVHALLVAGAGIGVLQAPVCADALAKGQLVRLLPEYEVPPFQLHALYPPTRPVPPKTRAAIDAIETCLPQLTGTAA
jgi:DNA-binding transcriptional LysR family regulator